MAPPSRPPRRRLGRVCAVALLLGAALAPLQRAAAEAPRALAEDGRPRILLLNAYHAGYGWTDDVVDGAMEAFREAGLDAEFYVEYMDTKRHISPSYFSAFRDFCWHRHTHVRFDLAIASDDNALQFLLEYHDDLYPGVPVVFCGVNQLDLRVIQDRPAFTGIAETLDCEATLALARRLHPGLGRVAVISDGTPTGLAQRAAVRRAADAFPSLVFHYLNGEDLTTDALITHLRDLPPDSIALITVWLRDREGYVPYRKGYPRITAACPVPVYALADTWLGLGVIGGKLASGRLHGRRAAEMGLAILDGADPAALPVVREGVNAFLFDHAQLRRWGIPERALPPGAIVLNRPEGFYHRYRSYILAGGVLVALEAAIIAALLASIVRRRRAERALRESEEKYRLVVENADDLVIVVDTEGRFQYVSPSYCGLFGKRPDELLGRRFMPLVHEDDRAATEAAMAALRRPPYTAYHEQRALTRHGWRWIAWADKAVLGPDGGIQAVVGAGRDVTEQRRAREALHESEQRYRRLVENMPVACCTFDREGRVLTWNRAARQVYGYEEPEAVGRALCDLVGTDETRAGIQDVVRRVFAGETVRDLQWHDRDKAGRRGHRLGNVFPLTDAEGKVTCGVSMVLDVTARTQAEEALRRERDFANRLVETAQVAVVVLDTAGHALRINRFGLDLVGAEETEVLGRDWVETYVHAGDRATTAGKAARVLDGEAVSDFTNRLLTRDGRVRRIRWSGSPLRAPDGRVTAILGIGHDITELEEKEMQFRQAQKMEAVGRLAGGIAHDFNNQLTVIEGYCDLVLHALPDDSPHAESMREVLRAADAAARLTSQLLTFSRKQILRPQVLDLGQVLRDMVGPLRRMIGERVRLDLHTPDGVPPVYLDLIQFQQAVYNLAVNARDAMPDGGRLDLTAEPVAGDDDANEAGTDAGRVAVRVADTGVGMDAATRRRAFEPFFTTKGPGMGTGLGLAMVYGFVRQSGGTVDIETVPGEGTTFTLMFPALEAEAAAPVLVPAETQAAPSAPAGGTVLVVEDEESVRQLVVRTLREAGYTALEAGNAREAQPLGRHYDGPIDLLVTDVVMPDLDGPALARDLAAARPEMAVLFITGYPGSVDVNEGRFGVRAALLTKPFAPEELREAVADLLEGDAA